MTYTSRIIQTLCKYECEHTQKVEIKEKKFPNELRDIRPAHNSTIGTLQKAIAYMCVLMRLLKRNKKPTRRKNKNRLTFSKPNERRLVFKPSIVPYILYYYNLQIIIIRHMKTI